MKKKILLILLIFFVTGCYKKNYINTQIIEEKNMLISINYPVTNTKLDTIIKKDIEHIYNEFKNKNYYYDLRRAELNIDYIFEKIDKYISVTLFIYINSPDNIITNYVKTYVYDNKLLNIGDFVKDTKLLNRLLNEKLIKSNVKIENKDISLFSINKDEIIIYFLKDEIVTIKIKLEDLNIKLKNNEQIVNKEVIIPDQNIDFKNKVVAITFDDGPSRYTDEIIEYLYSNRCSSTFFVLGNKVNDYKEVLKKSLSYGNELGNHSYSHKLLTKLDKEKLLEQINRTQDAIEEVTGYIPKILRPTYGSVNKLLRESTNLDIILWNVDTLDWKYKSINKIVSRAVYNLKDGNIILMHDTNRKTLLSLKKIIPILKNNGYKCVTVSELKEIKLLRDLYE